MSDLTRLIDRNASSSSSPALPPPPPPPAPPPRQGPRYSNRAASALARIAQPFFVASRPPSPHATHRPEQPGGSRSRRSQSLPGASQTVTHKTGLAISAVDISPQRTHAIIGGKEILKTINVSADHSSEEFNIRNAVISYSSTHHVAGSVSARLKDQLNVKDVKWSHGNFDTVIATAVANGRIIIYDLRRSGLELSRFQGHSRQVHKLAINPHYPAWLLSGSQDATIRMWDLRTAFAERGVSTCTSQEQFMGNSDAIRDVRWSPTDGVMFAAAADSGAIQLWDWRKPSAPILRIAAHEKPCYAVDWHPDGKHLVSGGTDKQVKVWDFSSSAERRQKPTFQFRTPQAVLNVRWRPACWVADSQGVGNWQSTQVVTSYDREDPRIHLWDLRRSHIPFREFDRYDVPATDLLWHSKDLLWTVGETGAFTQTDIRHAPQVLSRRPMSAVSWSPTGEVLMFTQKRSKKRIFSFSTAEFLGFEEEEGNAGTHLLSQSPADDELEDASFVSSSLRPRHSKSGVARPTKSLGSTPPSTEDIIPVLSFEKSLAKSKPNPFPQPGIVGIVPQATSDAAVTRDLASHYSPLVQDVLPKAGRLDELIFLLESLDFNAEQAEDAGIYHLSQTWRLVRFSFLRELYRLAQEQGHPFDRRKPRAKDTSSQPGTNGTKVRPTGEGRHDKMKSRLFRGVMETEGPKSLGPDIESTSNMTTPLAQPLPDSPGESQDSSYSHFASLDDDSEDLQPLPPSVLSSNHGTLHSSQMGIAGFGSPSAPPPPPLHRQPQQSSEDPPDASSESASFSRMNDLVAQEPQGDQRSAPLAIAVPPDRRRRDRANYLKGTSEDDYDQQLEDRRAAIRDYKVGPKKLLSLESPVETMKQPAAGHYNRRESSESFPMFSASTDSSHPARSVEEASFSPRNRGLERYKAGDSQPERDPEERDHGSVRTGAMSPFAPELGPSTTREQQGMSSGQGVHLVSDMHLERPTNPPPLVMETVPMTTQASPGLSDATLAGLELNPLLFPGLKEHLTKITLPVTSTIPDSQPWSAENIIREAIRYFHSSGPVDLATATHLIDKLTIFFRDCDSILPHEEREFVLKAYNESLLRQAMHVEAAELRLACVPSYPTVYEYAQVDAYINVFCVTCKRPFENPHRDNTRCYRCNTSQEPCSICMSIDPPLEWVAEYLKSVENKNDVDLHNDEDDDADKIHDDSTTSILSSPLSSKTELITSGELHQLGLINPNPSSNPDLNTTIPRPKGSALWSWCQGCGHGGHMVCMTRWLGDTHVSDGACATAGCNHDCAPGPRRDDNRAAFLEESKRRDSAGRKAGAGFVKRDPWTRGESKAVEKVRGMLGGGAGGGVGGFASPSGATISSAATSDAGGGGSGGTSSGVMSPKKVRLVTPSEQGKRTSNTNTNTNTGPARGGSNVAGPGSAILPTGSSTRPQ